MDTLTSDFFYFQEDASVRVRSCLVRDEFSALLCEYFLLPRTGYQTGKKGRSFSRWQVQARRNRMISLISGNAGKDHPVER